jgi:hypothetical protein
MKKISLLITSILFLAGNLAAQLTAFISDSTNLSCYGIAEGSATVSISGGTTPYEIQWNDDSLTTQATATNLEADRWYRVTVSDADMNEVRDSVILSQPEPISYELEGLKIIQCHGPSEGYLKITASGGTGPHSYSWSGEITSDSDSINNLTAGQYFYMIEDSLNCRLNDSLTLEEADRVDIVIDSVFTNPCLGLQLGGIYISASGGVGPYAYSWTGPSEFTSQLQDISGLKEGLYCLDLTDARGCTYEKDTSIVDGDPISVSHTVSIYGDYNLVCYGDATGSIRIDTVAGNGLDWRNYTYIWTGPNGFKAYEHEISNLEAGNYHLNVFDSVNCRSNIAVTLNPPPSIYVRYDSVITNPCIDDNNSAIYITALNGEVPLAYSWTGPGNFTSSSEDITGLSKGRYNLTVSDANGCQSDSDTGLYQVDNIDMVLAISEYGDYNISCNGAADGFIKILSVAGYGDISGFTFLTTGPDGFTSPFRFITSGVKGGSYNIKVTDPLGCSGEKDTVLTQPARVATGSITGATDFIHDSNFIYMVDDDSENSIFTWSVEGGEIWSGQGTKAISVEWRSPDKGKVKVLEVSEDGCSGDTVYLQTRLKVPAFINLDTYEVNIYPNPVGTNLYIRGMNPPGGRVEFYSLLGKLAFRTDFSDELNVESLERGVYYLRVKDENEQVILTRKIIKK